MTVTSAKSAEAWAAYWDPIFNDLAITSHLPRLFRFYLHMNLWTFETTISSVQLGLDTYYYLVNTLSYKFRMMAEDFDEWTGKLWARSI